MEIVLAVGQLEESVIVTGEAPMLQTDRTDTGRIIESTQITQMPLGFNRNFQALLITVPGASRPFRPHSEFYNSQESLSSNVNGQSRQVNNVQLEGADNSDNGGSLAFYIPSAEAIETVSVATSNYDAEFGRAGGAVTNVTIKSGTNTFGGSAFAFGNTEATMSRNPFTTLPPADSKYMQAGFTFGGPIKRNKLFFFGDFVRTSDDSGRLTQGHVPEPAFRNGDFSAAPTRIYDPSTGNADGSGRTQFANNQIPANRISPIARRLIDNIPMPNIPGAAVGAINFEKNYVRERRTNQGDIKITYQVAQNDLVSVRCSQQNAQHEGPGHLRHLRRSQAVCRNGHQSDAERRRHVQQSMVGDAGSGGPFRPHASSQRSDRRGLRAEDVGGVRHQGHQPERLHQRHHDDRRRRLQRLPDRLRDVAAVGSRREHLDGVDDRHEDVGQSHAESRRRPALEPPSARPGEPSARRASSTAATRRRSTPTPLHRTATRIRSRHSCWTCRTGLNEEMLSITDTISIHRGGTHKAVYTYVQDKWQIRPDITLDLGLAP